MKTVTPGTKGWIMDGILKDGSGTRYMLGYELLGLQWGSDVLVERCSCWWFAERCVDGRPRRQRVHGLCVFGMLLGAVVPSTGTQGSQRGQSHAGRDPEDHDVIELVGIRSGEHGRG